MTPVEPKVPPGLFFLFFAVKASILATKRELGVHHWDSLHNICLAGLIDNHHYDSYWYLWFCWFCKDGGCFFFQFLSTWLAGIICIIYYYNAKLIPLMIFVCNDTLLWLLYDMYRHKTHFTEHMIIFVNLIEWQIWTKQVRDWSNSASVVASRLQLLQETQISQGTYARDCT